MNLLVRISHVTDGMRYSQATTVETERRLRLEPGAEAEPFDALIEFLSVADAEQFYYALGKALKMAGR